MLEFTLVGIPMIFVLISIFEMSRGMWIYHTVTYAVKEGVRFSIVHGQNCTKAPNSCAVTVGQVAGRIQSAGTGLLANELQLTFTSAAGSFSCRLDNCLQNDATWPPPVANTVGNDVEISGTYPFRSAIAMFWPGGQPVHVGAVNFPVTSRERIQF